IGKYKFGQLVKHRYGAFTIVTTPKAESIFSVTISASSTLRTAQAYKSRLIVALVNEKTSVVSLSLTDPVPHRAEDFLNALIDNYNRDAIEDKGIIFHNTSEFIEER